MFLLLEVKIAKLLNIFTLMFKKIYAEDVVCQMLLNTVSSIFKFLPNWDGRQNFIKNITAVIVIISGIIQVVISSVCLI